MPTGIYPRTQEHRDRISAGTMGRKVSKETREKISKSHKGKPLSTEHKHQLRLAKLGVKRTLEEIRKRTETRRKNGWNKNPELTRIRHSEANKGQIPWILGKKMSEEMKKKISKGNMGKKLSPEHIKKLSLSHMGIIPSKETIAKIVFNRRWYRPSEETKRKISQNQIGKIISKETRLKISKSQKGKKISAWHIERLRQSVLGRKLNEKQREAIRQRRMHQIFPHKDTSIEVKLQDELSARGYGYYKHYPIFGQPDIAFPDQKIAIFCDGDWWHQNPEIYDRTELFDNLKPITHSTIIQRKRIFRDKEVNEKLREKGWLVLRYWEHEINANTDAAVDEIEDVLFTR
jgi:DNA mismatch endonuclease (patch repair protein)